MSNNQLPEQEKKNDGKFWFLLDLIDKINELEFKNEVGRINAFGGAAILFALIIMGILSGIFEFISSYINKTQYKSDDLWIFLAIVGYFVICMIIVSITSKILNNIEEAKEDYENQDS